MARRIKQAFLFVLLVSAICLGENLYRQKQCEWILTRPVNEALLPHLTEDLNSSQSCIRSAAALQAQKLGPKAAPLLTRLLELNSDPDDSVRWRSLAALGYINENGPEVEKSLLGGLKDKNSTAVVNALFSLTELKLFSHADAVLPLTRSSDNLIKNKALIYLQSIPPTGIPGGEDRMIEMLGDPDPVAVQRVIQVIGKQGYAKAGPALVQWISSPSTEEESVHQANLWFAKDALRKLGEHAATGSSVPVGTAKLPNIAPLVACIKNEKDVFKQGECAEQVLLAAPFSEGAVGLLDGLLSSTEPHAARYAARILGRLGSLAQPALPGLIQLAAEGGDDEARASAAQALSGLEDKNAVVESLIGKLAASDELPYVVKVAVWELLAVNKERFRNITPVFVDKSSPEYVSFLISRGASDPSVEEIYSSFVNSDTMSHRYLGRTGAGLLQKAEAPQTFSTNIEASCAAPKQKLLDMVAAYEDARQASDLPAIERLVTPRFYAKARDGALSLGRKFSGASFPQILIGREGWTAIGCEKSCRLGYISSSGRERGSLFSTEYRDELRFVGLEFVKIAGEWKLDAWGILGVPIYGSVDEHALEESTYRDLSERFCSIDDAAPVTVPENYVGSRFEIRTALRTRLRINGIEQLNNITFENVFTDKFDSTRQFSGGGNFAVVGGLRTGKNELEAEFSLDGAQGRWRDFKITFDPQGPFRVESPSDKPQTEHKRDPSEKFEITSNDGQSLKRTFIVRPN